MIKANMLPVGNGSGSNYSQPPHVIHGDRQQPQQQIQQKPYLYRMSLTSDDKLETTTDKGYEWQQVKTTKRIHARQVENQNIDITSNNRFIAFPLEESVSPAAPESKIPKPPPIFIYGVANYNEMVNKLS
jgi:hypothetical protein